MARCSWKSEDGSFGEGFRGSVQSPGVSEGGISEALRAPCLLTGASEALTRALELAGCATA